MNKFTIVIYNTLNRFLCVFFGIITKQNRITTDFCTITVSKTRIKNLTGKDELLIEITLLLFKK